MLVVSTAGWIVVGALLNITVDVLPSLFRFQQYLLACSLFGMGLGFFKKSRANEKPSFLVKIVANQALWLALLAAILSVLTDLNAKTGLVNEIGLALQDSSPLAFVPDFIKSDLYFDILSIVLIGGILFIWIQIFVPAGAQLKQLAGESGNQKLELYFGAGAFIAWTFNAVSSLFFAPPVTVLIVGLILFAIVSATRKTYLVLGAMAVAGFAYTTLASSNSTVGTGQYSELVSNFWKNGSRIDTHPIVSGKKIIGLGVWLDRLFYQFVPAPGLSEKEKELLQKLCGLPMYSLDYMSLPFRAMPSMKGKSALILGAGVGPEVTECLDQGLAQVTAVESQKWLTLLSRQLSFSPYANPAVTLVPADPRQYIRQAEQKYDLIIFTGLWPVTRPNPFIFLNHNDYLFTQESLAAAYALLKPEGRMIIVSPAFDNLRRSRLAATVKSVVTTIEAELSTPFNDYLIVNNSNQTTEGESAVLKDLRKQLGSRIVNYVKALLEDVFYFPPSSDNRPFMVEVAPMIPLEDTFFTIVVMIVSLLSLRLHAAQSMFQTFTRPKCRAFFSGSIFMVCMIKGCMIMQFEFGDMPTVIYLAIISGWFIFLLSAILSLKNFFFSRADLPLWCLASLLLIALAADYGFNYEAAYYIADPLIRLAATTVLPWLPALMSGSLLNTELKRVNDQGQCFGLALLGFSLACLLALVALFQGIPALDMLSLGLLILSALATIMPVTESSQAV